MRDSLISNRKRRILNNYIKVSTELKKWERKNRYFLQEDCRYLHFLVPEGLRVLDLGCGTGDLLNAVKPSDGVGVDLIPAFSRVASERYPQLHFLTGDIEDPDFIHRLKGPFDAIILGDTIGELDDIQTFLDSLHHLCTEDTRVIIIYYNTLWEPLLKFAEKLGLKRPQIEQNWLSTRDIYHFLELSDFEVIKQEWRLLIPLRLLGVGRFMNKFIGPLPVIRKLCLRNYAVARSRKVLKQSSKSATTVIPCRNERGNIDKAIARMPHFCDDHEIIFVEGHSSDGTLEEIHRVISAHPDQDIKVLVQPGKGKADAVRAGFGIARGDILMILDADLTMPPEDLPKYYQAIISGKGEFINGSRLVYPMEQDAMRFLNHIANSFFSILFTYLLNQRFTDTLCGTKALYRKHYTRIAENRSFFGDFDPFGDFDLIFGATKLNLKVTEVPIRYTSREYGISQISRFSHGLLLVRMVLFAFRKLKTI
jgi:SAM-dependent methyltransferase